MRRHDPLWTTLALPLVLVSLGLTACDAATELPARPATEAKPAGGKADQWNAINNPERLNVQLEYRIDQLPTSGLSETVPWPDTYWPTYEDSINVRWQGDDVLSPAEKYDHAFNGWTPADGFMDLKPYTAQRCKDQSWDRAYYDGLGPAARWVSANKGNAKARDGVDNDKDGQTDECDDRDGVETWWGLCHAWVPAAMLEPEPLRAVTHNGVTFDVSDIKALIIMQYDRASAILVGGRCNDKEVKRDETGRLTDDVCRDTNAGSFHVIMANFLGLMKRPIAEDRTYDYEVWNQPILEWKVDRMDEITEADALRLLERPEGSTYAEINPKAVKFYEVESTTYYITESHPETKPLTDVITEYTRSDRYHYVLEVDADGKVNGGEWIGYSRQSHPDFLWLPIEARGGNPYIDTALVRSLIAQSRQPADAEPEDGELVVLTEEPAMSIPDNTPEGVTSELHVGLPGTARSVEVEVEIRHTYVGDLKVWIEKDGQRVVLHDRTGGSQDDVVKTFKATGLAGAQLEGVWVLGVSDHANADVGELVRWSLKLLTTDGEAPVAPGSVLASSEAPVSIPDNTPAGATSTLEIGESKVIKAVKVHVEVKHDYVGALRIELAHGPLRVTLHDQEGAGAQTLDKTWDLAAFNGASTAGPWTLTVVDTDAYGDQGQIVKWSLELVH